MSTSVAAVDRLALLPAAVQCVVYACLPTIELLRLRAVSHGVSTISRRPAAWRHSSWTLADLDRYVASEERQAHTFSRLYQLGTHTPYLRSVILSPGENNFTDYADRAEWVTGRAALDDSQYVDFLTCGLEGAKHDLPVNAHAPGAAQAFRRAALARLTYLEHVINRYTFCVPEATEDSNDSTLPRLRHIVMQDVRQHEFFMERFDATDLERLCTRANLLSFVGRKLRQRRAFPALSESPSAATMVVLRLWHEYLRPFDEATAARFAALEEFAFGTIVSGEKDENAEDVEAESEDEEAEDEEEEEEDNFDPTPSIVALGAMAHLRILSLTSLPTDAMLEALLSSHALATRLEYLSFGEYWSDDSRHPITRATLRRLMVECTRLLVFRLPMHECQWRAVTPEEWADLASEPPLPYEEIHQRAEQRRKAALEAEAAKGSKKARQAVKNFTERPVDESTIDFGFMLTAPLEFRRRTRLVFPPVAFFPHGQRLLGHAEPDVRIPILGQIYARYPHHAVVSRALHTDGQKEMMHSVLRKTCEFMTPTTCTDKQAPTEKESPAAMLARRPTLTPLEYERTRQSPFHFLRAIKRAAGMPLHPSEANPEMTHCWPDVSELETTQ